MVFIVVGGLFVLLKYFEIGPFGHLSWWLVCLPLIAGLLWFEIVEPMFGLDKKRAHDELERVKKSRIKQQLDRGQNRRR